MYNVPMQFLTELEPLGWVVVALAVISIILLVMVIRMHFRLKKFLIGINSDHIGDSLTNLTGELKELQQFRDELEKYITGLEKRVRKSLQSVHTVRFNPFKGTGYGGNQSFATAFLNEEGDGVLLSSLYSRDHVSIYSKPIKKHVTEHELSEEEREALEQAKFNLR
jgi:hypothetical protein